MDLVIAEGFEQPKTFNQKTSTLTRGQYRPSKMMVK